MLILGSIVLMLLGFLWSINDHERPVRAAVIFILSIVPFFYLILSAAGTGRR